MMAEKPSATLRTLRKTIPTPNEPITADGHHSSIDDAIHVADYFASEQPNLRTYVVEVVYRADAPATER